MNPLETKQAILRSLASFATQPISVAATALFQSLGYRSQRRLSISPNTPANFLETFAQGRTLKLDQDLLGDWRSVDFLFQLTDEEIRSAGGANQVMLFESKGKWSGSIVESYLFMAIQLVKPRYTRTQLSAITRAVNRLFEMPVMILFRHGDALTLAVINRRLHRRDESRDVLEKVTLVKDIQVENPHRAHIEILYDLSLPTLWETHQFTNFKGLHEAWQKTLDSSDLNKRFYQELANWYFWALDHVRFPNDAKKQDGKDHVSLIRLITRLIFCWFLREKGLIPDELFQPTKLQQFLDLSDPQKTTYYKAVLQNLFFATLNTEMDTPGNPPNRKFSSQTHEGHMVHTLYRYQTLINNPAGFLALFRNIPFLNGGLFECLDERNDSGETRVDGFSDHPRNPLTVPDFLFFGPERRVDLSDVYGELRYSQAAVRPLIPLLEGYKFTVSENTPIEEEVALDPELLGHVFENLLAAYNPETDTTARKTTGSFYTPRVVVDFMVDESLLAHLQSALEAAFSKPSSPFEPRLRHLLAYSSARHQFSAQEVGVLVGTIDNVKILDPACGSGAYPMGALHKLVLLLSKLDPGNVAWKERQLAKARELDVACDAAEQAVEDAFARDRGDYARKLYLIENCLYGVDIQPIAVQIAKLRCFISLIVEQEPDDNLPNRGILPLPNLETKFIAANTLLGLHRIGQMELLMRDIEAKKAELRQVRHEHFLARRYSQKKALRKRDQQLRAELGNLLKSSHLFSAKESEMVANWDPYHADRSADFFDLEWMFGLDPTRRRFGSATLRGNFSLINETNGQTELLPSQTATFGFDIVIGNPPYVRQEEIKDLKPKLKDDYFCYTGVADLFVYFYEKSFDFLRVGGVLCFVSSNKYLRSGYGQKLRHFLARNGQVRLLIDFGDAPVFTAIAYPSILLVRKIRETREKGSLAPIAKKGSDAGPSTLLRALNWESGPPIEDFPEILTRRGFELPQRALKPDGWRLESSTTLRLFEKLRRAGSPLGEYVQGRFYNGVKSGHTKAFMVDRKTRDDLLRKDRSSADVLKPYLLGRDLRRWRVEFQDRWLIYVPWHFPLQDDSSITTASQKAESEFKRSYPAVYARLEQFKPELATRDKAETGIRYEWYALARPRYEIHKAFQEPKIILARFMNKPTFAYDEDGYFNNNASSIISGASRYLAAVLNSLVAWWFLKKTCTDLQSGYIQAHNENLAQIPIPRPAEHSEREIAHLVTEVLDLKKNDPHAYVGAIESLIDGMIAHVYGLTEEEFRSMLEELSLPDPTRLGALNAYRETKRRTKK